MITGAQIRAARALAGWKQSELAAAAGISEISVKNIERGAVDPRASTLGSIERAFEARCIIFAEGGVVRRGDLSTKILSDISTKRQSS